MKHTWFGLLWICTHTHIHYQLQFVLLPEQVGMFLSEETKLLVGETLAAVTDDQLKDKAKELVATLAELETKMT